ncbi:hypothetical protein SLS53_000818 [Cytospora paraplurivora]|uniref:Protein ARV n=1 Tax=Cytospora paraplurivora TaxID=2898453 RepID=A0AAN9UIC2_9PEZI
MVQCVQRYPEAMVEDGGREGGLGECERFGAGGMVWNSGEQGWREWFDPERRGGQRLGHMGIAHKCRHPVKTLWTQYSGAGDKSSGHNIRLTVCRNCGRFCDKYVEHDYIVLFIDLVLIKPQVYRHLLHNTLMRDRDQFDPSIIRLGILLLLFDVYLTWARIEKQSVPEDAEILADSNFGRLAQQPIVFQYMFFRTSATAKIPAGWDPQDRLTIYLQSDPLYRLYALLPPVHPLPDFLTIFAPGPPRRPASIPAPQLSIDRTARIQ